MRGLCGRLESQAGLWVMEGSVRARGLVCVTVGAEVWEDRCAWRVWGEQCVRTVAEEASVVTGSPASPFSGPGPSGLDPEVPREPKTGRDRLITQMDSKTVLGSFFIYLQK